MEVPKRTLGVIWTNFIPKSVLKLGRGVPKHTLGQWKLLALWVKITLRVCLGFQGLELELILKSNFNNKSSELRLPSTLSMYYELTLLNFQSKAWNRVPKNTHGQWQLLALWVKITPSVYDVPMFGVELILELNFNYKGLEWRFQNTLLCRF